jgi:hypothetical protein
MNPPFSWLKNIWPPTVSTSPPLLLNYDQSLMGQKVRVILSWINPSQNRRTIVNNVVLKILTNHISDLAWIISGQNGRRRFNFKYIAWKYSGETLSIHSAIICSYESKSYGSLILNKSKRKYTNNSKQYRAKNPTNPRHYGLTE